MDSVTNAKSQGLKDLRERCVRRATYLLGHDPLFRDRVFEERAKWVESHPRYHIQPAPFALDGPAPRNVYGLYLPFSLQRDVSELVFPDHPGREAPEEHKLAWERARQRSDEIGQHFWDWQAVVEAIRRDAFPDRYYPASGLATSSHPMDPFISACMVFTLTSINAAAIERLTPSFDLALHSLGYPPPEPIELMNYARAVGERDYLREVLRSILSDDPERYRSIMRETDRQGLNEAARRLPHSLFGPNSPHERWWYIPVPPTASARDLRALADSLPAALKSIFQTPAVDDLIQTLLEEGMSHSQVAVLLGIGSGRVTSAKKRAASG